MVIKKAKSQIATIIAFIIAVLFLFTLMSINISQVAQKKTAVDNVADGVGLQLASQLGSMASALKQELKIYEDDIQVCKLNWKFMVGPLLAVSGVVVFALSGWTVAGGFAGGGLVVLGALWTAQGAGAQFFANNPGAIENMNFKLKNLSNLQQVIEMPVGSSLFGIVGDDGLVRDTGDIDMDGDTQDFIPRFVKWYDARLNSYVDISVGDLTRSFYLNFFDRPFMGNLENGRFVIRKNEETLTVMSVEDYKKQGMSQEAAEEAAKDAIRWRVRVDMDGDGPMNEQDIILARWFKDELPRMLAEMRKYGYGINVDAKQVGSDPQTMLPIYEYEMDEININDSGGLEYEAIVNNSFVNELEEFENLIARSLYDVDFDSAVQGVDSWIGVLKNEKNEDWYTRLEDLKQLATKLRDKLFERKNEIEDCVRNRCISYQSDCCGWGTCTRSVSCGTEEEPEKMCDEDYECCTDYGCCGGISGCGILCGDGSCPPTYVCRTPLQPTVSGNDSCCKVTELEPYNKARKGCYDNIVDVYPNRIINLGMGPVPEKYNAPEILYRFIADIVRLQNLINNFNTQVQNAHSASYNRMHEAFYIWTDKAGDQSAGHIAYAKIEGLDPNEKIKGLDEGFKVPYIKTSKPWKVRVIPWAVFPFFMPVAYPQTCVGIGQASGEFTLTVGRWDQDTPGGPLSRFWSFRSGRSPATSDVTFVDATAARFQRDFLDSNRYPVLSLEDKNKLINLISRYGIVSKVRVNYGPGFTYKPEKFPGEASKRNKDIYIKWASSDFNYNGP